VFNFSENANLEFNFPNFSENEDSVFNFSRRTYIQKERWRFVLQLCVNVIGAWSARKQWYVYGNKRIGAQLSRHCQLVRSLSKDCAFVFEQARYCCA